jgi:hypothetical protein
MKTATVQILHRVGLSLLTSLAILIWAPSVYAAFYDDFEDGDHAGWLVTITGNTLGSTGVELHNGSMMAVVQDTGATSFSLSRDFAYAPDDILSFTMQAIANSYTMTGGGILNADSGVTISFLNVLNSTLGSVTIANATDPGSLPSNSSLVDTAQHDYSASISDFAGLAGLNGTDPIAKMNLNFYAAAETYGNVSGVAHSSSTVWFDNVSIVPVPAATWLFGSGLLGIIGIARRKKSA